MNWNDIFESKPDVMSGAVVFKETRIPIEALFDNLASGLSVDGVLQNFPRIGRERAEAALQLAARELHHSAA